MITINITGNVEGFKRLKFIDKAIIKGMENSLEHSLKVGQEKAIEDYRHKRITKNPDFSQSRIVASFSGPVIKVDNSTMSIQGTIWAGGNDSNAPYTKYVDEGWALFGGHHFLPVGMKATQEELKRLAGSYISNEIHKLIR